MASARTYTTLRTETDSGVRSLVLCRPDEYNTINPTLRDDLSAAIDEAEADPAVHVLLLRAEGRAFCAGYGLDWATPAQGAEERDGRVWDSVSDLASRGARCPQDRAVVEPRPVVR